jgi:enterochelin esterase-like enzyme
MSPPGYPSAKVLPRRTSFCFTQQARCSSAVPRGFLNFRVARHRGDNQEMMARRAFALLSLHLAYALGQVPTHTIAAADSSPALRRLRQEVGSGKSGAVPEFWTSVFQTGTPLVETIPDQKGFSLVTFLWRGDKGTRNVVIFDGVAGFDAKDQMLPLAGTDVWYKTYRVRNDARFAYSLSPNDSLQSINNIKDEKQMQRRLAMLQADPLNPHQCPATFGAHDAQYSYVELPDAPPLVWESSTVGIPRGRVEETSIHSALLRKEKRVWVYTPAASVRAGEHYPLVVLFDGDRNVLWIPKVLDVLIAQRKIPATMVVMTDQSLSSERGSELACNPQFTDFLAQELVPWSRDRYHTTVQPERVVVAGSSLGGLAAVFAGLRHPEVFGNALSLSGSFWWKPQGDPDGEWLKRHVDASRTLPVRFYLEVGLMEDDRMQVEPNHRMRDLLASKGYSFHYSEYNGGHSFLNWSQGFADGLRYFLDVGPRHLLPQIRVDKQAAAGREVASLPDKQIFTEFTPPN